MSYFSKIRRISEIFRSAYCQHLSVDVAEGSKPRGGSGVHFTRLLPVLRVISGDFLGFLESTCGPGRWPRDRVARRRRARTLKLFLSLGERVKG